MPSVRDLFSNNNELTFRRNHVLEDCKHHLQDLTQNQDAPYLLEFIINMSNMNFTIRYIPLKQFYKQREEIDRQTTNPIPHHVRPDYVYEITYHNQQVMGPRDSIVIGYHGSGIENIYSILTNSLQNYSNTEQMKHGSAFGEGIYACEDLRVARDFSSGGIIGWDKSTLLGTELSCVVQCRIRASDNEEVVCKIGKEKNKYIVIKNSERVRIQYLLIYSHVSDVELMRKRERNSTLLVVVYILILLLVICTRYYTDIRRQIRMWAKS